MELLVVLAILGFALALAAPSLIRALPGLELQTSARAIAGALREARTLAIAGNREVTLVVDVRRRTLQVGQGNAIQLDPRFGLSLRTATTELHGRESGGIRFFPDGTSTGGSLILALGERQRHVVVDWLTGAVSVTK
jgi:general secretion pathway protein H